MSNYTKNVDYASKDGLAKGTAAKKILGTEIGAEFDEIETVSATKLDEDGGTITAVGTLTMASSPVPNVESGEFTPTWSGFSSPPTGDWSWHKINFSTSGDGQAIVLLVPQFNATLTGTSNAGTMKLQSLPATITPNSSMEIACSVVDNSIRLMGVARIESDNEISFFLDAATSFTGSGNKGVNAGQTFYYVLNNGG